MEENIENRTKNEVSVVGKVDKEFYFSHEYEGEGFYKTNILVDRLNDTNDRIPVIVSDRLLDMDSCYAGKYIALNGEFRSYNSRDEEGKPKRQRLFTVFAHDVQLLPGTEGKKMAKGENIYIEGFLSKPPIYRVTPLGREITELCIAVRRNYGRTDHIPCICWGRNARFASGFHTGDRISACGRIQSRDYTKHEGDNDIKHTTCEVSVKRISREEG
ncbi:MAG: single-stranded DNA-binding protein [Blautia sp.]|nr:single-stranded DNA-binding protein [Blautia sp.]